MVFQSKYAWGGIKYSVSADTVGAVLEDIEQQNGTVSKELFLDASRSEDSPTHGMFEWDDSIAGEKWRLDQARKIICSLSLKIEHRDADVKDIGLTIDNDATTVPAFVSIVPRSDVSAMARSQYINVSRGLSDQETREIVLKNAMRLLKVFKDKYSAYVEFAQIISDIDALNVRLRVKEGDYGQ